MKANYIKIISMLLALALMLFAFAACSTQKDDTPSSSEPASSSEVSSTQEPETSEPETSEPEDTADDEDFFTDEGWDDDWSEPEEGIYYEPFKINNTKYVNEQFMGIGFIHEMFSRQKDKKGRVYNDAQIAYELDTMKKMNIKTIRAYYGADYSWDPVTHTRNFESEEMLNFYQSCKDMESIGITIGLQAQWSLRHFLVGANGYNNMSQFALSGLVTDDFTETCQNYRRFMKDTVLALKAHGINNVKYFFAYTECHNTFNDGLDINGNPTNSNNEDYEFEKLFPIYDEAITALHNGLKDAGLRNQYKIVGPCDNWVRSWAEVGYSPLVKYTVEELSDVVDIIGTHNDYAEGNDLAADVFYDIPQERQEWTYNAARAAGKEHWLDEFNVRIGLGSVTAAERRAHYDNPIRGVAAGAMINGVLNYGYADNLFIWSLSDEQWPDNNTGGIGSEFDNGVQLTGYLPCLFESSRPYRPWYAMSLMTRYIGAGKIYECEVGWGIYISAIERDDGELTVLVTNYNLEAMPVEISFEKSVGGRDFYRYTYENDKIVSAQGNEMITADGVAEKVTNKIYDTIKPYSVTVYSTQYN